MKNINIFSKDIEINEAIEEYVEKRVNSLEKLFSGVDENDIKVEFRIGKVSNSKRKGDDFFSEIKIRTPKKNYGAKSEASDLYESVDALREDIFNKISGTRNKKRTLFLKGAAKAKRMLKGLRN